MHRLRKFANICHKFTPPLKAILLLFYSGLWGLRDNVVILRTIC